MTIRQAVAQSTRRTISQGMRDEHLLTHRRIKKTSGAIGHKELCFNADNNRSDDNKAKKAEERG